MKKSRKVKNKERKKNAKSGVALADSETPITTEKLVEQGTVALANMQLELAEKFFVRALALSPEDTNIMDALADIKMQLGNIDGALALLTESTSKSPSENPFKWLFLGQLQEGLDAVRSYSIGIETMMPMMEDAEQPEETRSNLRRAVSKAHSSIAELYMTDLCYEEGAESNCEQAVERALAIDPMGLDALQTQASLRISQQRRGDAAVLIDRVAQKVLASRDAMQKQTVLEVMAGTADTPETEDLPEMDFCISTAKLLIECSSENKSLATTAMNLVSGLIEDVDDNVELWYLMGVAAMSADPVDVDAAGFHLEQARAMLRQLRKEHIDQGESEQSFPFSQEAELVEEHLRILATYHGYSAVEGAECGNDGNNRKDGEMPMDEEWSTCDEEEEGAEEDS